MAILYQNQYGYINGTGVRVRYTPVTGEILYTATNGDRVKAVTNPIAASSTGDGYNWLYITNISQPSRAPGYVREDLVRTETTSGGGGTASGIQIPVSGLVYYNRGNATRYAVAHGKSYTSGYSKNGSDADCANFVSQCLFEGGVPMDATWHYNKPYMTKTEWTSAWISTNQLRLWLESTGWATQVNMQKLTAAQVFDAGVNGGDIAFTYQAGATPTSYTHVTFISWVGADDKGVVRVYECGHTNDKSNEARTLTETTSTYTVYYKMKNSNTVSPGSYYYQRNCPCGTQHVF